METTAKNKKSKSAKNKILGINKVEFKTEVINYEDKAITYKVTNLTQKNTPIIVNGQLVETFIGGKNQEARKQLRIGADEVITYDNKGNELYKIEVIK